MYVYTVVEYKDNQGNDRFLRFKGVHNLIEVMPFAKLITDQKSINLYYEFEDHRPFRLDNK